MPSTIEKVNREFKGEKFVVLAIDYQEAPERVGAWAREHGITSTVLLDRDGAVTGSYRVTATPTVVLIGKDGKMVARGAGARPWDGETGRALIKALVAAPAR